MSYSASFVTASTIAEVTGDLTQGSTATSMQHFYYYHTFLRP
jgi:hypothetical protein